MTNYLLKKILYKSLLKFFLKLHDFAYQKSSAFAIRYYGVHPKHKFEDFHQFFIMNIPRGAEVLDIGCSRGELTTDLASMASKVVAYDLSERAIETAKKDNFRNNIYYFVGEAVNDLPKEKFNIVVCSNILEHLSNPVELLKEINKIAEKVLIRVPNARNNWTGLVKKDIGMDYFLDPQHYREYTLETLSKDLNEAGWQIESAASTYEIRVVAIKMAKVDAR